MENHSPAEELAALDDQLAQDLPDAALAAALARLKTVLDQAVRETFAPASLPW